ncbi:hypothetical protein FPV67DRAFT_1728805 [Lyophyllum atratum]|nr:hypothetical protein FPV67DRAFT_1728805 [Lyophyllum atratum]
MASLVGSGSGSGGDLSPVNWIGDEKETKVRQITVPAEYAMSSCFEYALAHVPFYSDCKSILPPMPIVFEVDEGMRRNKIGVEYLFRAVRPSKTAQQSTIPNATSTSKHLQNPWHQEVAISNSPSVRGNFLDLEPGTRLESSTKMSSSILRNALSLGLSPGHLDPVIPESRADFSSNLKSPMVLWLSMGTTKFCSREENFSSFVIMTHSNVGISSTTRSYGRVLIDDGQAIMIVRYSHIQRWF